MNCASFCLNQLEMNSCCSAQCVLCRRQSAHQVLVVVVPSLVISSSCARDCVFMTRDMEKMSGKCCKTDQGLEIRSTRNRVHQRSPFRRDVQPLTLRPGPSKNWPMFSGDQKVNLGFQNLITIGQSTFNVDQFNPTGQPWWGCCCWWWCCCCCCCCVLFLTRAETRRDVYVHKSPRLIILSTGSPRRPTVGYRGLFVVGCWLLVIGDWLHLFHVIHHRRPA